MKEINKIKNLIKKKRKKEKGKEESNELILTDFDAILKDASIVSCPFNKFSPFALNLIKFTAFPSILEN
jgi:hypothetical protein